MNKLVLGYVTCPNVKVATELASKAVNSKLAACGNIIPGITSVYEWQGKVETETEGTNYKALYQPVRLFKNSGIYNSIKSFSFTEDSRS